MRPVRQCTGGARRWALKAAWRLVLPAAVAAFLSACGDSGHASVGAVTVDGPASRPEAPPAIRVALIMKTLTNPFFIEMERGARQAQQEAHIDLRVETATQETAIEQQIQLVDDEIKAGTPAIVIAPGDSTRLVPVLKKAQDAGIKIVNIDNRLDPAAVQAAGMKPVPFVSVDNEKGAFLAARLLAQQVHKPTQAAILEGILGADNAQQRRLGAERGLHANPEIRIVAEETANWKIDEGYAVTGAIFKKHPDVGVLFCSNDMMAIGAIKYLQESHRTQVQVAGFDALDEAKAAIRAGQMLVTVDQQAAEQGRLGVQTALALLQGRTVPMAVRVDTVLVTAQDLK